MSDYGVELLELYKKNKNKNIRIFNLLISCTSILTGVIELMKFLAYGQLNYILSNYYLDILIPINLIICGFLIPYLHKNKNKLYKITLFLLTCCWGFLLFFYISVFKNDMSNFTWVLIINIITQLLYTMKMSDVE